MKINFSALSQIVPSEQHKRIRVGALLGIVHRAYCGPMTVKNLCTSDCQNCRAALIKAFRLEMAENPAALLTWRLKQAAAEMQEQAHELKIAPKRRTDAYGLPVSEENPFEKLARDYESKAQIG
jgi:hypothetical protein